MDGQTENKNQGTARVNSNWASPVPKLTVENIPPGALNLNVEGRQLTGPLQGFGQLWQKTYKVRLSGSSVTPEELIQTWRENFGKFWPPGNRFFAPLTRIEPGEVAVLNLAAPGGMPLSTGIIVIYVDDRSFTFMNPAGHMFGGWITFSAEMDGDTTIAQVQVLVRANDPLWEIVMRMGGFRKEDEFWHATLKSLSAYFNVDGQVQQQNTCVDSRLQWAQVKNIWYNAAIRSAIYGLTVPVRKVSSLFRRKSTLQR